jgi:hypothetical protein
VRDPGGIAATIASGFSGRGDRAGIRAGHAGQPGGKPAGS